MCAHLMELDHLFIAVTEVDRAAAILQDYGLCEGSPNDHPNQGTACRRVFFDNMMLELLWLRDLAEAQQPENALLEMPARFGHSDPPGCPIGCCFRPVPGGPVDASFQSVQYRPVYLPAHLHINIACDSIVTEPLWFHLPFATRQSISQFDKEPMLHADGISEVTDVTVLTACGKRLSTAALVANSVPGFSVQPATENLLKLKLGPRSARTADFRPALPLVFY